MEIRWALIDGPAVLFLTNRQPRRLPKTPL